MVAVLLANTELVALAWLKETFPAGGVGTILPNDATWSASGFTQVTALGGSSDQYLAFVHPVIGIDCWAFKAGSNKPPWGKANNLAETIRRACIKARPHRVTLGNNYPQAQFYTAQMLTEPRRVPDAANYARYNFSVAFHWAPVTP